MKYISVSFKNIHNFTTKEVKVCEKNQEGSYSFNKKLRWGIIKTYTKKAYYFSPKARISLEWLPFPQNIKLEDTERQRAFAAFLCHGISGT